MPGGIYDRKFVLLINYRSVHEVILELGVSRDTGWIVRERLYIVFAELDLYPPVREHLAVWGLV